MTQEQTPRGIYTAMAKIAAEIGSIGKDKKCQQGATFSYRGIDDVYNALNPIMGKHGVFVLPIAHERTTESRTTRNGAAMEIVTVRMEYKFCHEDGSEVACMTIGQAMDSGDKATNKAMAIAHKYAILQAFCIPTEDMEDPDARAESLAPAARDKAKASNPSPMTKPQSDALMAYLTLKHGDNRDAYLAELSNFFGRPIGSSRELTKDDVSDFLEAVNNGREAA
jgi:hypothetical protein